MIPSVPALLLWLFFLFLLPVLLFLKQSQSSSKFRLPPGPRPLPIIGNLHQLGSGVAHRSFYKLSKLHGPIMHLNLGRIPTVVVSSPSLAEQILKTHDLAFCSRPHLFAFNEFTFSSSDIAAAPYGDHWRKLRKVFALDLLGSKKTRSFRSVREEETERMIQSIKARANVNSVVVNVSEFVSRLTFRIVCRAALGVKDDGEYGERMKFQEILEEALSLVGCLFMGELFPGFGWIDKLTGRMGKLKRNARNLHAFCQEVIDKHLNGEKEETSGEEEDIVDVLLRLWREEEQLTMDNIKGALMDILLGGIETSSSLIIWAMTELAKNPAVMKKAQDEVRRAVGSKGKVEENDLTRLQYLQCVVCETLRLHPTGPLLIPRETMQHCQINGYDIFPKTRVIVNAWAIGRDKHSWVNPKEFNPERFMGSSIDYNSQHFHFIPFGGGRRICPGLNFGIANVELPLANLLYGFDWELPSGTKKEDIDMSENLGIAMTKKVALCLVAKNYS